MKNLNKMPIVLYCLFFISTGCTATYGATYTGTLAELKQAVADTELNSTFYQNGNITLDASLGSINTAGTFSVIRTGVNSYNVSGNSLWSGFNVASGQTLKIANIGSLNTDGSVATSFTGFKGATGSVINNAGTLEVKNSVFSNNTAGLEPKNGGAIYNSGTAVVSYSTFSGNKANAGNAIYNTGTLTVNNSTFSNNTGLAYGDGGAIASTGSLTINNSVFKSNSNARGGAIWGTANIYNSSFMSNVGNDAGAFKNIGASSILNSYFANNSANLSGGAITHQNYGTALFTITDSVFENNTVTSATGIGGAIFLDRGNVTVQASDAGQTIFSGNKDHGGTVSNAIYAGQYAGITYLNAGNAGRIIFDDKIDATTVSQKTMSINTSGTLNTGNIIFNDTVSNLKVNQAGGVLSLGEDSNPLTNTYFSNVDLNLTGGVLDLSNKNIDTLTLNSFTSTNPAIMYVDADLSTGVNDTIDTPIASGDLTVGGVNIHQDSLSTFGSLNIFTDASPNLSGVTAYTNNYKYNFSQGAAGSLNYAQSSTGATTGLHASFSNGDFVRSFSAVGNTLVVANLGTMGGPTSTVTVFGNGFDIDGGAKNGIDTQSGQTLNIYSVGSLNADGSVNTSWHNHTKWQGSVIANKGKLNVYDSVFSSNTTTSGHAAVLYNDTTGIASIVNSSFISNVTASGKDGGAIKNAYLMYIGNSTFKSNGAGWGGAINNFGATANLVIKNSSFASNTATLSGGAICNGANSTLSVTDTIFTGNQATQRGAAIYNEGYLSVTDSIFRNNTSTSDGGAIWNKTYDLTISGSEFTENTSGAEAGVLYNSIATNNVSVSDSTFSKNHSYGLGGAIRNMSNRLTIANSIFNENYSTNSHAGAILATGTMVVDISNSTFTGNHASNEGGVLYYSSNTAGASMTVSDSVFKGNYANADGVMRAAIPNLTIINSLFEGNYTLNGVAGAIYADAYGSGSLTITNSRFINNYTQGTTKSAGALYAASAPISTISDSYFAGNTSTNEGGAIYHSSGVLNLIRTEFKDNVAATTGGGLRTIGTLLSIDNGKFQGNYSSGQGGGFYAWNNSYFDIKNNTSFIHNGLNASEEIKTTQGGAIYISSNSALTSSIKDSTFSQNAAKDMGGAVYFNTGQLNVLNTKFEDNYVTKTSASNGGAIYIGSSGNLSLTDSIFTRNSAFSSAGALYVTNGIVDVKNTRFIGNYTTDNTTNGMGGAIRSGGALTVRDNSYFEGNGLNELGQVVTKSGGAIYSYSDYSISNSIFQGNASTADAGAVFGNGTGTSSITDSKFDDNYTANAGGAIFNKTGTLNIIHSEFNGNYNDAGTYAEGGAIKNNTTMTISQGSTFTGNGFNADGDVKTKSGGAIHNIGTLTIINSTFEDNGASEKGGAIHNSNNLYIKADGAETLFSGNTDSTGSNAIYSMKDFYINAGDSASTGTMGEVTFDDVVSAPGKNIYVNSSTGDNVLTNGIVNFNNSVVGNLNISSGTVNFLSYVPLSTMNITGGKINFGKLTAPPLSIADTIISVTQPATISFTNTNFTGNSQLSMSGFSSGLNIVSSTFDGTNYTNTTSPVTITSGNANIVGSTFSNYSTVTGNGGAIYNDGINTVIKNTSFINNSTAGASSVGGAIYNWYNMYIKADADEVLFSGNRDSTGSNAIYNDYVLYLNAGDSASSGTMGNIVFDDKIKSTDEIFINSTDGDATLTNGTITFNNLVEGGSIESFGGTVNIAGGIKDSSFVNQGSVLNVYNASGTTVIDGSTLSNVTGTMNLKNVNFINGAKVNAYATDGTISLSDSVLNDLGALRNSCLFSINEGVLNVDNSTFSNFEFETGSGSLIENYADLNVNDSSFINNSGYSGTAIRNSGGIVTITGTSLFKGNSARDDGGAVATVSYSSIFNFNTAANFENNTADSDGGALYTDSVFNFNQTASFLNNTAQEYGGAIYNGYQLKFAKTANFEGNSTVKYDGGAIFSRGTLTLDGVSTFLGNSSGADGGAIANSSGGTANINAEASFTSNNARNGGAIINRSGATLNINSIATFTSNTAEQSGGAISNDYNGILNILGTTLFEGNTAGDKGGAISNSGGSILSVNNSTFKNNIAGSNGGAIYDSTDSLSIIDSKFEGNTATNGLGGAIYSTYGTVNIVSNNNFTSSFTGNTDSTGLNDIYMNDGTLNLNAGSNASITFAGTVSAANADININSDAINPSLTVGTVSFNNSLVADNIDIMSGTTSFKALTANTLDISGGANTFNETITLNSLNITAGSSEFKKAVTSGTVDISGGTTYFDSLVNSSDIDIAGGNVTFNLDIDSSVLDITGGNVTFANGSITDDSQINLDNAASNISFTNSNFVGTNYTKTNSVVNIVAGSMEVAGSRFAGYQTSQTNGGVINNAGTLTITNTRFTDNNTAGAGNLGGAIYNTGILYIKADADSTIFSGNSDSTGSNDIYSTGNLYLNSGDSASTGTNGNITFGGSVVSTGDIHINSASGDANLSGGSITFNDSVGANAVDISNGTVSFNDALTANRLDITGGTVSVTGTTTVGDINISGGTNSFSVVTGSTLDITGGSNIFNDLVTLDSLNIANGNNQFVKTVTSASIGISGGTTYFDSIINTSGIGITGGSVTFNRDIDSSVLDITGGTVNFANGSINDNSQIVLDNATSSVGFTNSYFNGTNYTNTGSVVSVVAGTMNIDNSRFVGYTTSETNGGAVNNAGTMTIVNSRFTNNATAGTGNLGGAIYNTGTLYVKADGASTIFTGNSDSTGANDIYSTGSIYLNTGDSASTGTQGDIKFDGSVVSTNAIHINSTSGDANLTTGSVIFNDSVSAGPVDIAAGTVNFNDILNANEVDILGGNVTFQGVTDVDDFDISGGTTTFNSALASTNADITAGTVNFNSGVSSSTLNLAGGTTNINSDITSNTINVGGGVANIKGTSSDKIQISNDNFTVTGGTTNIENTNFINNSKLSISNSGSRVNIINSSLDGTGYTGSDSVLKVLSGTLYIDPTILANYSITSDGGVINSAGSLILDETTFNNNSTTANGGAIYSTGDATITRSAFNTNSANNGGAIYNSGNMTVSTSSFDSNSAYNGGALYNNANTLTLTNTSFTNNTASAVGGLGGAIYNKANLNIVANNTNVSFSSNKASGLLNDIYLDNGSKLNLNVSNGSKITFNGGITSSNINNVININKNGSATLGEPLAGSPVGGDIVLNSAIKNSTINLYGGTLSPAQEIYLNGNNLSFNSNDGVNFSTLNLINNAAGILNLNTLTLNSSANLKIDADLANGIADKISPTSVIDNTSGLAKLNINKVNLLSDSSVKSIAISVADTNVSNYVVLNQTTAESALYKYNLTYNPSSGTMGFENTKVFTPSVVTNQVGALVGSYLNQINTYNEALSRADVFMSLPQVDRLLMRYNNKYAMAAGNGPTVFSPTFLPEENGGTWFKQYTSFENIPLNNGPNVSNVGYGMLIGNDTPLKHFKNGSDGYLTAYVGYNGSHQNYEGVGIYQNGGNLGLTGTIYKGNFFAAATVSAGASNGTASTSFGSDNFTTFLAGAAIKAGYNWEFWRGKMILQPSYTMSYTFADTFDYQAASGAKITTDPLNAIQISPGIKLIGNLKDGWQPYLGVNMVWNFMDSQKAYANDVQLPQMSVDPYVEYGLGLQRKWGDRFTGFGQAMLRGGGRNGVALQFGFRWSLGK